MKCPKCGKDLVETESEVFCPTPECEKTMGPALIGPVLLARVRELEGEKEKVRSLLCGAISMRSGDPYIEEKAKEQNVSDAELVGMLDNLAELWEDQCDELHTEAIIQRTAREMERRELEGKLTTARLEFQNIVEQWEARSELFPSEEQCAATLADFAKEALEKIGGKS